MKNIILTLALGLLAAPHAWADYSDIPYRTTNGQFNVDGYTFSTQDGYYQEWDHFVIFWSTDYGTNPKTATQIGSGNYLLNLADMRDYAERCHTTYTNLGFLDPTDFGHKIIILAYHSTDWFATGSGYGEYGVLNIAHSSANPSAQNPYYTYCHEIAHAYQYLGNMKNGGNAGFQYGNYYGYVSYYENCANWQASQIYTGLHFPQISPVFIKTTNLAFLNQWHCYQSYPMNDYFTEKRSQDAIGKIWTINTNTRYADATEKYMEIYDLSADDVYKEFFWGAMRMVTWDLDLWENHLKDSGKRCDAYMDHKPGTSAGKNATTTPSVYDDNCWKHVSTYQYVTLDKNAALHQVAYSSCPQSTGFNVIKLNVPKGDDRTVTTTFTALPTGCALANGDNREYWTGSMWAKSSSISNYNTGETKECNSKYDTYKAWRGFRLGYVTYNKTTGERKYNYSDEVFCTGTDQSSVSIQFDVPTDADSLYLVVSPALAHYLRMGSVDPYNISSDAEYLSAQQMRDQWPYRVQFFNTNIHGLDNPSASFDGEALRGETYSSATLPDMGNGEVVQPDLPLEKRMLEMEKSLTFEASAQDYSGGVVGLEDADLDAIASLFGVDRAYVTTSANWEPWSMSGLGNGKLSLRGVQSDGSTIKDTCSTANGYGFWFNKNGDVCAYGDNNAFFGEYDEQTGQFSLGQQPGVLKNGENYEMTVAMVYRTRQVDCVAYIHFDIKIDEPTGVGLTESVEAHPDAICNVRGIGLQRQTKGINMVRRQGRWSKVLRLEQ